MKAKLIYQNYGTSILIFIKGEDAHGQYLSLFNWGATSSEPKDIAPNVIACWSTLKKFKRYFTDLHETRLLTNRPSGLNDEDLKALAVKRAEADFEAVETESFRSINDNSIPYELGEIAAEKPDEDFEDAAFRSGYGIGGVSAKPTMV